MKKRTIMGAVLIALCSAHAFAQPAVESPPETKQAGDAALEPKEEPSPVADPATTIEPEPEPPTKPTPWAKSVTAANKRRANSLRAEANDLFLKGNYTGALKKYQKAIDAWDHPAIRFALGRVFIKLDKPVEAYDNIEASLRYGQAPLDHLFEEAQNYKRLLAGQIAKLEVTCSQDDVAISVDGQPFFACPGRRTMRLRPGNHQVMGEKPGFLTQTKQVVMFAGPSEPVKIELRSPQEATKTVRYFEAWIPWAVAGGGVALGVVGAVLEVEARASLDDYLKQVEDNCSTRPCDSNFAKTTLDRAQRERGMAVAGMAIGSTALIAGIVGVVLNDPRQVLQTSEEAPQITPTISANSLGLTMTGSL